MKLVSMSLHRLAILVLFILVLYISSLSLGNMIAYILLICILASKVACSSFYQLSSAPRGRIAAKKSQDVGRYVHNT